MRTTLNIAPSALHTAYLILIITFLIGFVSSNVVNNDRLPPYPCVEDMRGWCRFTSIHLLPARYRFQPFTERAEDDVRKVSYDDSVIPVFAADTCDTFINLEELWLNSVEVKQVTVTAFKNCKKLRWLRIHNSLITDLPADVFRYNKNLKVLFIEENKIKWVNPRWFTELTELEELTFALTAIDHFPVTALKPATKLKKLVLYSNNLIDLDERLIHTQFPKLREIYYNHNEFSCSRLTEMNAVFAASDIKVMTDTWGITRLRSYNVSSVDGVDCLALDEWAKMLRDKLVAYLEHPQPKEGKEQTDVAVMARLTSFISAEREDEVEQDVVCQRKYNVLDGKRRRMQSLILEQQEFIKSLLVEQDPF